MATKKTGMQIRTRVGDLVLVEHGSSARGQVAVVVAAPEGGMVTVRKFIPARKAKMGPVEESLAPAAAVPLWRVKGKPEKTDERLPAARALLATMKGKGESL